jgi:Penicillin-insensitive murein endopeptidase
LHVLVYSRHLWAKGRELRIRALLALGIALQGSCAEPRAVAAVSPAVDLQAQSRNALLPALVEPVTPKAVVFGPIAPPEAVSDAEFAERFRSAPTKLGSLSLGLPNRGFLFNARELQDSAEWRVVNPEHAFATEETILALTQAVHEVNVRFPATPRLSVGDLSDDDGGRISPHRSHQSGRDVDIGLYYSNGAKWYTQATPQNLDAPRVWALIAGMYRTGLLECG